MLTNRAANICRMKIRHYGNWVHCLHVFITFYSTTKPLDKSWHVLGLGYNPSISMDEINTAAEVPFSMNMKPWLDIAMNQFRPLWSRYVDKENEYVQTCIFNFGDDWKYAWWSWQAGSTSISSLACHFSFTRKVSTQFSTSWQVLCLSKF